MIRIVQIRRLPIPAMAIAFLVSVLPGTTSADPTCIIAIVGTVRCSGAQSGAIVPVGPDRNANGNRMTPDTLGIMRRTEDLYTTTDSLGIVQPNVARPALRGLAVQSVPAPGTRCATDTLGITQCY